MKPPALHVVNGAPDDPDARMAELALEMKALAERKVRALIGRLAEVTAEARTVAEGGETYKSADKDECRQLALLLPRFIERLSKDRQ